MATVTPTVNRLVGSGDGSTVLMSWSLTSTNTDGAPLEWVEWSDRCFTATGTWGGATLTIQGSNDGSNWVTLNNAASGSGATLTANGVLQIVELPRYVRPNLTTAGAGATLTVMLTAVRVKG